MSIYKIQAKPTSDEGVLLVDFVQSICGLSLTDQQAMLSAVLSGGSIYLYMEQFDEDPIGKDFSCESTDLECEIRKWFRVLKWKEHWAEHYIGEDGDVRIELKPIWVWWVATRHEGSSLEAEGRSLNPFEAIATAFYGDSRAGIDCLDEDEANEFHLHRYIFSEAISCPLSMTVKVYKDGGVKVVSAQVGKESDFAWMLQICLLTESKQIQGDHICGDWGYCKRDSIHVVER